MSYIPPRIPENLNRKSKIKEIAEKILIQRLSRSVFTGNLNIDNCVYESIYAATKLYDYKIPDKNET